MKMIKVLEEAFNKQIIAELDSWYVYLGLAAWYESKGLHGFRDWMHLQAEEELEHAARIRDYLMYRGNEVYYSPVGVDIAKFSGSSPVDGMKESLKHEQFITKCIANLLDLSHHHNDHGAALFLQWFVSEQEEEEANVQDVLDLLAVAGDSGSGLLDIDKRLGKRKKEED